MIAQPAQFELISCSWPRPVERADGIWTSQPDWNAPLMPVLPRSRWEDVEGAVGLVIDWRDAFRGSFVTFIQGGEMRGFHVIFQVLVHEDGEFEFWDDDGCIIRRRGAVIHEDRMAHPLTKHSIRVSRGDRLEFAQWQDYGAWEWKGCLRAEQAPDLAAPLLPFLERVRARLVKPTGPPLKMFTNAYHPVRASLAIYSMILRGYSPDGVWIYGEHQWTDGGRETMRRLLPFAHIVPSAEAFAGIEQTAGSRERRSAEGCWWVFKASVPLLCQPRTCCMIDDDVVILDSVADALREFERNDLVYGRDTDYGDEYAEAFRYNQRRRGRLPTADFNAGLYWVRALDDVRALVKLGRRASTKRTMFVFWEQGYIAVAYAARPTQGLPTQRYFYPRFDGLPGDVFGYDWSRNPCGFASIHFGGMPNKPSDAVAALLAPAILQPAAQSAPAAGALVSL